MKAIRFHRHGGPEEIVYEDVDDLAVPPGHYLVRVRAVALNGFDPMILRGIPGLKTPLPMIPGGDIAGEIVEAAPDIASPQFVPGDRVQVVPYRPGIGMVGETLPGGAAELLAVPEEWLVKIPDNVSFVQAAALPIAYGTALRLVDVRGKIAAGETVLVLGATGGVGTAIVQLAKQRGAYVIAAAGSADKAQKLLDIGADRVIDTSAEDFVTYVHREFGKPRIWGDGGGVDVVVNYIGGETWTKSLRVLKRFGRMITCGATAGYDPKEDIRYIWSFELSIVGSNAWQPQDQVTLLDLVSKGELDPVIDRVLPLSQMREGLQTLIDRQFFGKVVLEV
ncbi:quinone oxidoreductase family protein [Terrihabitans sp. B22-R8]|uniref:quinone oxidoreductase family protein n=1 Tax=Terrihabitans sp. B22-R8 TaxID=3425128 RepID=UPI00403D13A8